MQREADLASHSAEEPNRRDFIVIAAQAFAGVGAAVALWPFIQQMNPDLVILDLSLPGMDGYDILRAFKADPTTAEIPVLVVSVHPFERPDDVGGFVAALRKPFDLPLLPAMLSLVGR